MMYLVYYVSTDLYCSNASYIKYIWYYYTVQTLCSLLFSSPLVCFPKKYDYYNVLHCYCLISVKISPNPNKSGLHHFVSSETLPS